MGATLSPSKPAPLTEAAPSQPAGGFVEPGIPEQRAALCPARAAARMAAGKPYAPRS